MRNPAIPGDIILFPKTSKNPNLFFQSLLRLSKARHSHVAVTVNKVQLIHAMPKAGVELQTLHRYLSQTEDFVVFRNKSLLSDSDIGLLSDKLIFYHRQRYSLLNMWSPSWRHSYCSELAAKAYKEIGIHLCRNVSHSNRVLPTDIYGHVSTDPDWIDITHQYKEFFLDSAQAETLELKAKAYEIFALLNQSMGYGQQKLTNRVNSINEKLGENAPRMTPPHKYWSNELASLSGPKFLLFYGFTIVKLLIRRLFCKNR